MASEFDCGTGRSKIAVRAEISTGTVMFLHVFATTEPTSKVRVEIGSVYIVWS